MGKAGWHRKKLASRDAVRRVHAQQSGHFSFHRLRAVDEFEADGAAADRGSKLAGGQILQEEASNLAERAEALEDCECELHR